jgi:hypothetical protein
MGNSMFGHAVTMSMFVSISSGVEIFEGGTEDDFTSPAEPTSPSPLLAASLPNLPLLDFDDVAGVGGVLPDSVLLHTFGDLPCRIGAGVIEFTVKAGNAIGVDTDGVVLAFVTPQSPGFVESIAWKRTFGPFPGGGSVFDEPDPGLLQRWTSGQTHSFSFDLDALPLADGRTVSVLPSIANHGFIDFEVGDETGVDFVRLTLTTLPPSPDLDDDGAVNGADLGILLLAWGRCDNTCCPEDLNLTGDVDGADLGILLLNWTL